MGYMRALVELNNDSLVPRDRVTNTWHFRTPGSVADAADTVETLLDTFYDAIDTYLGAQLTGTGNISFYDLEDDPPRAPVAEGLVTFSPASTALPAEVALCMSYQGILVSGANQARRRGRLFIGPLGTNAMSGTSPDVRVAGGLRSAVAVAAEAVMDDTTLPGLIWSVFSPSTAGAGPWSGAALDDAFITITNGWVNDSFDTMRSRGLEATARTVWPV